MSVTASGDWWRIEDGTFYVYCQGDMPMYTEYYRPWRNDLNSITSIIISSGVTSIAYYAFQDCRNATSVTIPNSVTNIWDSAFKDCRSLTSVTIPDSVTIISPHTFEKCISLTSVIIPDSATFIGENAFEDCLNLTSVTIPDGVERIMSNTFRGCESLTSVTIPDSITRIYGYAFYGCSSLADVYYNGTETQWDAISIGTSNAPLLNATIHFKEEPMPTPTRNPQRVVYGVTPPGTYNKLILEAGILVTTFDPNTGEYDGFIGATTGGVNFNANPNDVDFGEDVDGAPANTMQLKRRINYDPVLSGTLLSVDDATITRLIGAADAEDITSAANTSNAAETSITPAPATYPVASLVHITPSEDILSGDFIPELWLLADYTEKHNPGTDAGCVAIRLKNAYNTTGLQIQTTKNQKGTLPFEFHAHYDADNITNVPFDVYLRSGPTYDTSST